MTRERLQLNGRVELTGPRSDRFEVVGMGDRVEVRCDRLRSLGGMASLGDAVGRLVAGATLASSIRRPPAVTVVVRGYCVAELSPSRVTRLVAVRDSLGRSMAVLPAIRFGELSKSVVNRRGKLRDEPVQKQEGS